MTYLNTQRLHGHFSLRWLLRIANPMVTSMAMAAALHTGSALAAGEVTFIDTADQPATPLRYSVDGITYTWGMGQNQVMQGFTVDGLKYEYANSADRVELVRYDVNNVSTGNPCGVFVERLGASSEVLKANYPSDGTDTGNCDMAEMLASRVVNRGALNLFSNIGPNPKNVERVDYLFDTGVLAPLSSSALSLSGHVVAEKSGNNPLQIAAITSVDILGNPTSYGPLILVERNGCSGESICYGITNLRHNYTFFQNDSQAPQGFPSFLKDSTESVGMAFVSLERLGLSAGQLYYGFSYFADDVNPTDHVLTDVSTFPQDTDDEQILFGDGPDIYGGVSGYFLGESLSVATGAVFKDENGDGLLGEDEAGISDIDLALHRDSNGNGVFDPDQDAQLGPGFVTDISGTFRIPGLENGIYFVTLDEADEDIPPALSVAPGTNPAVIVIQDNDAHGVNFGFISDTGPTNGAGSDAGATDSGSDAGATDSGSDAGATDSGSDAGATDSGSDAGATDSGSDAGATDSGSDAGATDSGSDAGATDSGSDSGVTDSGSDSGVTDSGSDAGVTDSGSDSGVTDSGSDSGVTDSGSDAGATDSGSDAGATDASSTDAGSTAGQTDAGTTTGSTGEEFVPIGDGTNETVANPDSAIVTQGSSVQIFVLENDQDAPGQGLDIIEVTESPNATIEISEGANATDRFVVYTPDPGFMGSDSFLYVMEDAAGTQSTGTVSVRVVRFSDINNNGINDFEECDCDNLTIEVGVDGTALGAWSLISFVILSLLFALRRSVRTGRNKFFGVSQ